MRVYLETVQGATAEVPLALPDGQSTNDKNVGGYRRSPGILTSHNCSHVYHFSYVTHVQTSRKSDTFIGP